jgi:peptidoglycan/xylan/chitin deacetylase (PgdA/CDA1 family)
VDQGAEISGLGKRPLKSKKGGGSMYLPRPVVSSPLFHLLCRVPFLVVPIALGIIFGLPHLYSTKECCNLQAMVTFSFDDGFESTYTKAFPILQKYGYPATVFVIASAIDTPGYLTASQLRELQSKGWEIGSHTLTHRFLTELSNEELLEELIKSKTTLDSLGLKVFGIASPGGKYDEKVISAITQYYSYHRTSWPSGLNDLPLKDESDRYYLKAVSIEATTTLEEAKQWVLKAKAEKKWLIFIFHRIDETGQYNWSSQDFEELVRFVKEQGFQGVPLSSAL